jgi:hypothetical protein
MAEAPITAVELGLMAESIALVLHRQDGTREPVILPESVATQLQQELGNVLTLLAQKRDRFQGTRDGLGMGEQVSVRLA